MSNGDSSATPSPEPSPRDTDASQESSDAPVNDQAAQQAESQPSTEPQAAEQPPSADQPSAEQSSAEQPATEKPADQPAKLTRGSGPLAARGLGVTKPASPSVDPSKLAATTDPGGKGGAKPNKKKKPPRPRVSGDKPEAAKKPEPPADDRPKRVAVPNVRQSLDDDMQAAWEAELAGADIDAMLGSAAGMADRKEPLAEGARVHGQVLKIHHDNVFVSLGGPDEGSVPFEQFEQEPEIGSSIEVVVRGVNTEDGLYALSLPGEALDVSDWEDLEEGVVVEATVTGSNSGGLECKVGGVKGFIPISQISEYRVEDTSEFVDQKLRCVVTEASERRGNLVLSHRAVLEREREERRKEQLEKIEVGDELEGIVRSIKDFGAFVDLGGLDGLIHISKLSWDRVKHPSEVLEVGQKVKVKIDTLDKETRKISLSYRDLLENPWDSAEAEFAPGTVHQGTITRIANFGCFVRLAAGIEGLVHISELAHHRVSKVDAFVSEGQEVEVKVLSFDRDAQKISLSIKAAQQTADSATPSKREEEPDEPPREPAVKASHSGPLKGGNDRPSGGEKFGLRW